MKFSKWRQRHSIEKKIHFIDIPNIFLTNFAHTYTKFINTRVEKNFTLIVVALKIEMNKIFILDQINDEKQEFSEDDSLIVSYIFDQ